jgi:hypothetical protein
LSDQHQWKGRARAGSIAGHERFSLLGVYCATKFAARSGITVNACFPGVVATDMWIAIERRMAEISGAKIGENYEEFVGGIALGRAETPEDVGAFVSYLAKPDSDYMTGQDTGHVSLGLQSSPRGMVRICVAILATSLTRQPTSASEDFGSFGAEWGVPSVFWFVGGTLIQMSMRRRKPLGKFRRFPRTRILALCR